MEPLLGLDFSLVFLGVAVLILFVKRWLGRERRWTLTTLGIFLLSVGVLAAVVIDVSLAQREKSFRQSLAEKLNILRVGSPAPDFSLPRLSDGKTVRLGDSLGRKPVCLILSSFCWNIFESQVVHLRRLHQSYGDQIQFLFVHIRNAYQHLPKHLRDFGNNPYADKHGQQVGEGMERHHLSFTCLLDGEDRQVENLYRAFPNRLLLIDRDGRIAYDYSSTSGATVSWDEVEQWMQSL